jgi:hypothetical protein
MRYGPGVYKIVKGQDEMAGIFTRHIYYAGTFSKPVHAKYLIVISNF